VRPDGASIAQGLLRRHEGGGADHPRGQHAAVFFNPSRNAEIEYVHPARGGDE